MATNGELGLVLRARLMARSVDMPMHTIYTQQVSLFSHQPGSNLLKTPVLEQNNGVLLSNGAPYL